MVIILIIILFLHYAKIIPIFWDSILLVLFASIGTIPVVLSALRSLRNKKISVDLLASIALVVSLITKEWASAVFINLMLSSARIFSAYTEDKSRSAIKSLLKLRPEKVKVKRNGETKEESIDSIKEGDIIIIESGERIPVDGVVESGEASIDQSSLTGESLHVEKKTGDKVFSSTLNVSGSLVVRAEKVGADTTLEKIIKLVEESQKNKIEIKTTADKFTSIYIAITIVGTLALYFFFHNVGLVLSVLLVTCADDIAIAVPMAFSAAIGRAAQRGIIIKGGSFLEGLTKVRTLVVDKTGTLTKGRLRVENIFPFNSESETEIIKLAAMAEFFSEHPVAKAVTDYAKQNKIVYAEPEKFQEFSGKGASSEWEGGKIVCGKPDFLREQGVVIEEREKEKIKEIEGEKAKSVLLVGYKNKLVGFITLADEIKPEVAQTIARLKTMGVKDVIMLTGDNEEAAERVAKETGITAYHANLLPEDKTKFIKKYLGGKYKVAMVGDGVNDAASLALADVGIAMGAIGSDASIEAADIALMKDNFSRIPEVIGLGHYVHKISKQDFWIWGIVNAIGLTLVFAGFIHPEGAAAFNFITDFFPILNSLRLFKYKFK